MITLIQPIEFQTDPVFLQEMSLYVRVLETAVARCKMSDLGTIGITCHLEMERIV